MAELTQSLASQPPGDDISDEEIVAEIDAVREEGAMRERREGNGAG